MTKTAKNVDMIGSVIDNQPILSHRYEVQIQGLQDFAPYLFSRVELPTYNNFQWGNLKLSVHCYEGIDTVLSLSRFLGNAKDEKTVEKYQEKLKKLPFQDSVSISVFQLDPTGEKVFEYTFEGAKIEKMELPKLAYSDDSPCKVELEFRFTSFEANKLK